MDPYLVKTWSCMSHSRESLRVAYGFCHTDTGI